MTMIDEEVCSAMRSGVLTPKAVDERTGACFRPAAGPAGQALSER